MNLFGVLGAVSAFCSVALGAFGAHALKSRLSAEALAIFETGARYQMFHALALLLVAALPKIRAALAGWFFLAGTIFFSGSLYAIALTGVRGLGALTPFGGLCFLSGWAVLAVAFARS
jgi:uncharacterized membrane protein YgdD (TMEM256/DUF423 family)